MATQTQAYIQVPSLMDGDKIVVPQFWLGKDVEYRTDRGNNALSAAEYDSTMTLLKLAELRHAFFGGSEDYRQSALSERGYGEWTSTYLQDGKRAIERPENVVYRNGIWIAEGGKVTPVELPPNGWALEYDKPTGFPSRTSEKRKDAEKVFGDDTSYFYRATSNVRAVLRYFNFGADGPFYVSAGYLPDSRDSNFGGRACRRSEQAAEQLATPLESGPEPIISMSMQEYQSLLEAHQRVGDLLSRIKVQK